MIYALLQMIIRFVKERNDTPKENVSNEGIRHGSFETIFENILILYTLFIFGDI